MDYVTYYRDEQGLHPSLRDAFLWFDANIGSIHGLKALGNDDPLWQNLFLAGGALRSFFTKTPVNDFDIYFSSKESYERATSQLISFGWRAEKKTRSDSYRRILTTGSENKLVCNFSLIHFYFFPTIPDLLDNFDFSVAMCGMSRDHIVIHPNYFMDLQTGHMSINNIGDPLNTIWRIQKYAGYGFKLSREDMWKVAQEINEMQLPRVYMGNAKDKEEAQKSMSLNEVFTSS